MWNLGDILKGAMAALSLRGAPPEARPSSLPTEDKARRGALRRAGRSLNGAWTLTPQENARAKRANARRGK